MKPIICNTSPKVVIKHIKDFVEEKGNIKGIQLVDITDVQVVLLLDEKNTITKKDAELFWSGYQAALEGSLI